MRANRSQDLSGYALQIEKAIKRAQCSCSLVGHMNIRYGECKNSVNSVHDRFLIITKNIQTKTGSQNAFNLEAMARLFWKVQNGSP